MAAHLFQRCPPIVLPMAFCFAVLLTTSAIAADTGPAGREIYKAVSKRFIDAGLELGGKDPTYVAADADMETVVGNVVDGACYNAGQSCCAIERVYVHKDHYDRFLEGCTESPA